MSKVINIKTCPKCKKDKPFSSFYKNKASKDGLQFWCKECDRLYAQSATRKASMKRYDRSKEGKETRKRYDQTEEGKERYTRYHVKRLERAKTFGRIVSTEITTNKPFIDIWLRFDEHFGHMQTDYSTLAEYAAWSNQDHVYQFCGGDIIENAISTPDKQIMARTQSRSIVQQIMHLQNTLTDRTLGYIIGNHEGRSYKVDTTLIPAFENILSKKNIPVMRENNHVYRLIVNNVVYTFVLSHGWGGSQTPEFVIKKMLYDGLIPDQTDFIVVGHTHHNQPSIARDKAVIFDDSQMATKRMIGIRPGTFLYNPDYLKHGRETIAGNVILRLSTKKWNYRLFENLNDLRENDL